MSTEPNVPDPKTVREIAQAAGRLIVESLVSDHIVHKAMAQHFIGHDNVYAWSETYDRVLDELAAVLKPLTRPDEQPQDERGGRDGDVRAVADVVAASGATWTALEIAIRHLGFRFADRIAALEARDAKEGE